MARSNSNIDAETTEWVRSGPMHNPPHPGGILMNYLEGRSIKQVAEHMGVSRISLSRVLNGRAAISAEMALRIAETFGTDANLWLRMQAARDLWVATQKKRKRIKPLPRLAA
jgi:addiction module HigA family antidote